MVYDRFRQLASECDVRPEVVADVQSMDQALGLVAGGVACALLPAPPGLKYPGVVLRPFEPAYRLTYCFGWTERDALVEGLIQALPVRAA